MLGGAERNLSRPLARLRVLDLGGAESDGVGRLFADLGADVLKIEPPGGSPARREAPSVSGASVRFALQNANKRSAVLDASRAADRERLIELAGAADIVVDSGNPGAAAAFGTSCAALSQRFAHLVALSVTDFGTAGPRAQWCATDAELYALSTALSRTGPTTGTPVLPPIGVASTTAAVQAAWAALAAYYRRLRDGRGDYIDFSRFEGVLQALDPPYGSEGQAAVGRKQTSELWRGRPRNQQIYPIFACRDGYVRICLLSPRQWRGMFGWLGSPEQFADPKFETIAARYAVSRELNIAIAELVRDQGADTLVAEGQARGVPIAAVLTPAQTLSSNHFCEVGALTRTELAPGVDAVVPAGPFVVDGRHTGLTRPAPAPGVDDAAWADTATRPESGGRSLIAAGENIDYDGGEPVSRPFEGMRILDLGVIVAGGELGRLFADLGAEVIKIESAAYPDGLRQTPPGMTMSRSWALTHRNEYSLGLDLRHRDGAAVFARLVAESDAVFANFKPGTLASLGFSYEKLTELNPAIVLAESSAFGASGPWSARMGYGPLVRATTGVTSLWTSPDAPPGEFYDATTIFPDHISARITAIAALAALVQRRTTGTGAHVHISQAEVAVNQLATVYATAAARAAGLPVADDTAVHGVYPCAGDDEWCVVSVRTEAERAALATVVGDGDTTTVVGDGDTTTVVGDGDTTTVVRDGELAEWSRTRDKNDVANMLQQAGIAAAPMNRAVDVLTDPQVRFRRPFTDMVHPLFDAPMPTETGPAPYTNVAPAPLRPAPMPGQHTREICQKVLGLTSEDIDRLVATGALFAHRERP